MSFLTHPEPDVHIAGDDLGRTYTPDVLAFAIAYRLLLMTQEGTPHLRAGARWNASLLEICVGGGAFVRAWRQLSTGSVWGHDIDPKAHGLALCDVQAIGDASAPAFQYTPGCVDYVATNIPWGDDMPEGVGQAIVDNAINAASIASAIIMPLDYQTQTSWESLIGGCSAVWPLLPRPWKNERGVAAYVWLAEGKQGGTTQFEQLRWQERRHANNLRRRG